MSSTPTPTPTSEARPRPWLTAILMVLCLVTGVGLARVAVAIEILPRDLRMPTGLGLTFFFLTFGEVQFSRTGPRGPVGRRLLGAMVIGALMFAVGYYAR